MFAGHIERGFFHSSFPGFKELAIAALISASLGLLNVSIWKNEKNTEKKTNQRGGNLRVNRTHFFMQMDESGIQQAWLPMEMSFMSSPFLRYWEGHDDKESSVSR